MLTVVPLVVLAKSVESAVCDAAVAVAEVVVGVQTMDAMLLMDTRGSAPRAIPRGCLCNQDASLKRRIGGSLEAQRAARIAVRRRQPGK
jgi:hypothetical protein